MAVESVILRPADPSLLQAAARRNQPLHRLEWIDSELPSADGPEPRLAILGETGLGELPAARYSDLQALLSAIEDGAEVPNLLVGTISPEAHGEGAPVEEFHAAAGRALELAQAWVGSEQLEDSRLCILTNGAVAIEEGDAPDLCAAPVWGLLRSAQSEHPGRFSLLDTDGEEASQRALGAALAAGAEERSLPCARAQPSSPAWSAPKRGQSRSPRSIPAARSSSPAAPVASAPWSPVTSPRLTALATCSSPAAAAPRPRGL